MTAKHCPALTGMGHPDKTGLCHAAMFPDTDSVFMFGMILLGFLGTLQISLWWQDRTLPELGVWGAANLLVGAGLAVTVARATVPPRISIELGNAAIVAGSSVVWLGVRRFERRRLPLAAAAAGPVLWLALCQVPAFYQAAFARVAGVAAIIGAYELLCAMEFLSKRTAGDLPSRRIMAILFLLDTGTSAVRLLAALSLGAGRPDLALPSSYWFGVPVTLGIAFYAGTSVLQIAVTKEAAERRSNAVLVMARDGADRANLAKSRFLARMSHELRTPLNSLLGAAQVLTRDPAMRGTQRQQAVMIERSGRHLLAIINDILDSASIESGQFQLAPRPALVADIVQSSTDLVAESAAAREIVLDVGQDPDVPGAVLADALRVRQILVNLLGNAIKFTPRGGRVALDVAPLSPGQGLRLTVTDTGPGVPPEFRPHLFRDFAQRPVTPDGMAGTGLGLAISASLAAAMGGTVTYEPGPDGVGSRFAAVLPLPAAAAPPPRPAEPPAVPRRSGLRVLVVDDVLSNRRLAEALLEQAGHRAVLAEDGFAAIAAMQAREIPDIVLMDLHMPGMDGLTAARRIRALPGRAGQVPILAVTADVSADRAADYVRSGMNGAVSKPIDVSELLDAIAAAAAAAAAVMPAGAASPRSGPATHPA